MMGQGPINRNHFPTLASMLVEHMLTMLLHQLRPTPISLKHRLVHGSTTHSFPFWPNPLTVNPLQGLVLTQQETADVTTDMRKPRIPAKYSP
jgi:hypothetical protein